MNINAIKKTIGTKYLASDVSKYCAYLHSLATVKDNKGNLKNPWMQNKPDAYLARVFIEVAADGLVFDGENITLQNIGVSYNYQAYKNKMLLAYPETLIDINTVHGEDKYSFKKDSGNIFYTHEINNPFDRSERNLKGVYCIIKNKRGSFLTLLSKVEIDKHRKVAKTDYIWKNWYLEMVFKTVMKKACKQHFNDIYKNIERIDNEQYDLSKIDEKPGIGVDNLKWLTKFCIDHKILSPEDKALFQEHYKFDAKITTSSQFSKIKTDILKDYKEDK